MYPYSILTMGGFPRINWPSVPKPAPIHIAPIHIAPIPPPKPVLINIPAFKPLPPPPPPRLLPPPPPIHIDIPKPKIDMGALQKFTGALAGAVAITPVGKLVMTGITGLADATTHGAASNYLNSGMQVNSTISMLPGGVLAQRLANDASDGKSGDALAKFVPDPIHLAIHDAKTVGAALVANPSSTLAAINAVGQDNRDSLLTVGSNYSSLVAPITTLSTPSALSRDVSAASRPSLLSLAATTSTLTPAVSTAVAKPALFVLAGAATAAPALATTLSLDINAAVVKPQGPTTLSVAPIAASTLAPPVAPLAAAIDATPVSTLSSSAPATVATVAAAPLATTLSGAVVQSAPGLDLGYLPAVGIAGVLAMMLL